MNDRERWAAVAATASDDRMHKPAVIDTSHLTRRRSKSMRLEFFLLRMMHEKLYVVESSDFTVIFVRIEIFLDLILIIGL